jgi:hypothetical protein
MGRDPAFEERFAREARSLAKLNHPNIVGIYDFGQTEGLYFLVMEYVEGANVRELITKGGLKPQEALAIVPQICEALQFAHDEGIVHRDIKPENILVDTRGRVKIADFGLAKIVARADDDLALTATQQVLGTLHYMAPEQLHRSDVVDHRADIYSLGVVFYEMLTGEVPVGNFDPPSRKVHVDVRLDEVVLRALEREPKRRYQHASEVKTAVEAVSGPQQLGTAQAARKRAGALLANTRTFPADPARTMKGLFWLLVSLNAFVVLVTAIFSPLRSEGTGPTVNGAIVIRPINPGLFGTLCEHINCSRVFWTACAFFILSAGLYWFACAWLGFDAYPGRHGERNESRGLWKWLFATNAGWAVLFCVLGIVVAMAPWAIVEKQGMVPATPRPGQATPSAPAQPNENSFESLFLQESRWLFAGVDSDVGFSILLTLLLCGLLVSASSASVLVPRCPPALVMTAGGIVMVLTALYIGLNIGRPVAVDAPSTAPPWLPWINANLWMGLGQFVLVPIEGMIVKIRPTVSPFLELLVGFGLCVVARKMRRGSHPIRATSE